MKRISIDTARTLLQLGLNGTSELCYNYQSNDLNPVAETFILEKDRYTYHYTGLPIEKITKIEYKGELVNPENMSWYQGRMVPAYTALELTQFNPDIRVSMNSDPEEVAKELMELTIFNQAQTIKGKIYVHKDDEALWYRGEELGLSEDANNSFSRCMYELEFDVSIDKQTGKVTVYSVDGHEFKQPFTL